MKTVVPAQFDTVRKQARRAIAPMKPVDDNTKARKDFLFSSHRAVSAAELPPQHLIYFLLVELLGFRDLGRFEKLAWSIPIDLDGKAFLIEHRKFGVGVFTQDEEDVDAAKRIAHDRYDAFDAKRKEATRQTAAEVDDLEELKRIADAAKAEKKGRGDA